MSVTDLDKVDFLGTIENGKCLQMVISDHLDWEDEEMHLILLQDKINAYLTLLQDEKWVESKAKGTQYVKIMVFFVYDITENCQKFLQAVQDQVGQYGVKISATIADETFRKEIENGEEDSQDM